MGGRGAVEGRSRGGRGAVEGRSRGGRVALVRPRGVCSWNGFNQMGKVGVSDNKTCNNAMAVGGEKGRNDDGFKQITW